MSREAAYVTWAEVFIAPIVAIRCGLSVIKVIRYEALPV